ncbi:MAG: putative GNAT family acetyltransferase [Flavobacterium sp.]|jgi:predicted GNAT family acetyltransferase
MSEVLFKNNDKSGIFYIEKENKTSGKLTFTYKAANKIVIDHTEVDNSQNGKGFGKDLVKNAVDFAREKNLKIIPQCSFAKSVIENTPEFQDVL